jgi:hypothetical protein
MSRAAPQVLILTTLGLALAAPARGADDPPPTEKQKIEALIKHIAGLKDAVFIRNDREYDAEAAATFLRRKWEAEEKQVKTARDFVEKVARASSTSGKPYRIRLKDGTEKKSGDYLLDQLKKLEKRAGDK